MTTKKASATKTVKVTRKFLNDLAGRIYDTKSRKFLRLCDGTLQNGPDPVDVGRPMHCGLGELYFAMTGRQPKQDNVNESKVIDMAAKSAFRVTADGIRAEAITKIRAIGLPDAVTTELINKLEFTYDDNLTQEGRFRSCLEGIPDVNDNDGMCGPEMCTYETYRSRASRVAKELRNAAKLLPE